MLLTITAAAEKLGVRSRTIRAAVENGALPAFRFNARVLRVDEGDLAAWAARCRTESR